MYINNISISNFRTFRQTKINFVHPEINFSRSTLEKPRLENINLLLGDNGNGKTSLLRAVALACLGPTVGKSGIFPYKFIREEPSSEQKSRSSVHSGTAQITADFNEDVLGLEGILTQKLHSQVVVERMGDLESLGWTTDDDSHWRPIFESDSDRFFFVGYGATRRVEQDKRDSSKRRMSSRAQRVQGLFEDGYTLVPLSSWFVTIKKSSRRWAEIVDLINELIGAGHYRFTGEINKGEYIFEKNGLYIPFPALSDGYRTFIGWIGDLLYHIYTASKNSRGLLNKIKGIVMVDEIDLHLHPKWQMTVLPNLSKALPKIQFIVTSHSPLLVGSIQRSNIIMMKPSARSSTKLTRLKEAVHGLDADQVLLTGYFGLKSTRSSSRDRELQRLTLQAREGDQDAAIRLLRSMRAGNEDVE